MKLDIRREDEVRPIADYPIPVEVTGLRQSKLMSPPTFPLWLCISEFDAGGALYWSRPHGDEALYVFEGELDLAGATCRAGGVTVVESDVPALITVTERSRIGHYGSWTTSPTTASPLGPPEPDRHVVHVVNEEHTTSVGDPTTVMARFYANAGCRTCRLSLFEVTRDRARPGRPHSHSQDEIIYILDGSMHLGAHLLTTGTALSIPGHLRYAEGSGEDGCVFLNFRRDVSDRTDFVKGEPPSTSLEGSYAMETGPRGIDVMVEP